MSRRYAGNLAGESIHVDGCVGGQMIRGWEAGGLIYM